MNVNALLSSAADLRTEGQMLSDVWPRAPGTYALVLKATRLEEILVGSLGLCQIQPGYLVYVGSALGPGGLRARLARHLRLDKPAHWHVNILTARLPLRGVFAWPSTQRLECAYVRRLLAWPGATAAVPGFGSSDCREGCPAHLILLPGGLDGASIAEIGRQLSR